MPCNSPPPRREDMDFDGKVCNIIHYCTMGITLILKQMSDTETSSNRRKPCFGCPILGIQPRWHTTLGMLRSQSARENSTSSLLTKSQMRMLLTLKFGYSSWTATIEQNMPLQFRDLAMEAWRASGCECQWCKLQISTELLNTVEKLKHE